MSDSILQVATIKDKGGNATGITVADSSANVTIGNLTASSGNLGTITQRSASSSSPTFSDNHSNTITLANLYGSTSITIGHPSNGDTHAWLAWDYGAGVTRKITKVQGKFHGQSNNTGIFLEGSNVASPNASAGHSDWTALKTLTSAMTNGHIYSYSAPVTATTLKYRHYRIRFAWSSNNGATIEDFVLEDTDSTFDIKAPLNATGSAPIYACRAWVNFDGTGTPEIRDSGNVSSLTQNTTGQFVINFTTAMPHANYAGSMYQNGSVGTALTNFGNGFAGGFGNFTTTSAGIGTHDNAAYINAEQILVSIFC